jgi:hypothetical protein
MARKSASNKSGSVRVTVDYGYDIHSIEFSGRTYARILAGKALTINGQGFHWDGIPDQDYWHFNAETAGFIYVNTEGGGDIYSGHIDDGEVRVEIEEPENRS